MPSNSRLAVAEGVEEVEVAVAVDEGVVHSAMTVATMATRALSALAAIMRIMMAAVADVAEVVVAEAEVDEEDEAAAVSHPTKGPRALIEYALFFFQSLFIF